VGCRKGYLKNPEIRLNHFFSGEQWVAKSMAMNLIRISSKTNVKGAAGVLTPVRKIVFVFQRR
jgi:hypothetical protein